MRTIKTVGIVLVIYLIALLFDLAVASNAPDYQGGIAVIVILGALAFLVPKVGYRWFDCFFAAIPFYGIYFIFKIAYRISYLPQRDWSLRDQVEN